MKINNLLLLHGALADKRQFDSLIPFIQDRFNIHTLDFDGHGSRHLHQQHFRIENFVETVLEYLDENKLPSINIFGYSMGGLVGLCLASKYAERVKSIFTLAVKYHWSPEIAINEGSFLDPEKLQIKFPHYAEALKKRHTAFGWMNVLERTKEMFGYMGSNTTISTSDLQELSIPIRVSVGDKDRMVSIEETAVLFRNLPKGQLQIFPNTSHPFEKISLEELSNAIISFFST